MSRIFNIVTFSHSTNSSSHIQNAEFSFCVPGVNSGIYDPATLYIETHIKQWDAGFFKLKPINVIASMVLSRDQFDELYNEMTKIKALRDSLKKTQL